ncbi:hypothetical protein MHBO_005144, partial [Bonamia ostreae]
KQRLAEILEEANSQIAEHESSFEVASKLIARLMKDSDRERSQGVMHMSDALMEFYETRNKIDTGDSMCVKSGYQKLDKVLGGGFVNGGFYILAARPAENGSKVFYIPLEMSVFDMMAKIISTKSGVPASELMMKKFEDHEIDDVYDRL